MQFMFSVFGHKPPTDKSFRDNLQCNRIDGEKPRFKR